MTHKFMKSGVRLFLPWADVLALHSIIGHHALIGAVYTTDKRQQKRIDAIRRTVTNDLRPIAVQKVQP